VFPAKAPLGRSSLGILGSLRALSWRIAPIPKRSALPSLSAIPSVKDQWARMARTRMLDGDGWGA